MHSQHAGLCEQGDVATTDYEMECILEERVRTVRRGKRCTYVMEYLVKWVGWPVDDATWEKESAFFPNCVDTLFLWKVKPSPATVERKRSRALDLGNGAAVQSEHASLRLTSAEPADGEDMPAIESDLRQAALALVEPTASDEQEAAVVQSATTEEETAVDTTAVEVAAEEQMRDEATIDEMASMEEASLETVARVADVWDDTHARHVLTTPTAGTNVHGIRVGDDCWLTCPARDWVKVQLMAAGTAPTVRCMHPTA